MTKKSDSTEAGRGDIRPRKRPEPASDSDAEFQRQLEMGRRFMREYRAALASFAKL